MIASNKKLKVNVEKIDETMKVSLQGEIDEDAKFQDIHSTVPQKLVVDMSQIRFINSCGLRNWVNWMRKLSKGTLVIFENCPRPIVDQINILDGLLNGAVVHSFYVPYYCESCNHEETYVAKRGVDYMEETVDDLAYNKIPFSIPCPKCTKQIEMDVLPIKYFNFLKKKKR